MKLRWPAVAFDLDGLLLDSEPFFLEAARRLLAKRNIAFDPTFMHRIMGMPGRDSLPLFRTHFDISDTVEMLSGDYRFHFIETLAGQQIALQPGARKWIETLHAAGTPIALATSSSRPYVDRVFAPHELMSKFQHILTCESVTHGKPAPDVYLLAAEKLGVAPADLLVFEDSPHGATAAKAAGCTCVAVPQSHTPHDRVAAADFIATSLDSKELLAWVEARPA